MVKELGWLGRTGCGFTGPSSLGIIDACAGSPWWPDEPGRLTPQGSQYGDFGTIDAFARLAHAVPETSSSLFWNKRPRQGLVHRPPAGAIATWALAGRALGEVVAGLHEIPFDVFCMSSVHREWPNTLETLVGFGGIFPEHGQMCGFRGVGHRRLASRRWLDFGPWALVLAPDDTSYVFFHDPYADWETALQQATPGHRRMGISDVGGYFQNALPDRAASLLPEGASQYSDTTGRYDPATKMFKRVVMGREVPQYEMLEMARVRWEQALGPDMPVERVAFVFIDPSEAQQVLHECWLREVEVYAIIDGREVRLDDSYSPTPTRPEWARAVEQHVYDITGWTRPRAATA